MNYEKKYKEALEWARKVIQGKVGFVLDDVLEKFPELKESEDKRMMNQLHSWMKEFSGAEEYTEKVYNWLQGLIDKQSEQKPAAKYKVGDTIYYDSFGRLVSFVIANIVEDGTDNPMYEDKDGNSVFQNDIVEQKPAWSEEDEYLLDETIKHLEALIRITKKQGSAYSDEIQYYQRDIDWLKSLRPQSTWKPSDEMLEALYRVIPENVMEKSEDDMLLDKLYQGLKYGKVLSEK